MSPECIRVKSQKVGPIGIVVADEVLRAVQRVDGRVISSQVPITDDLSSSMRLLLSSSSFSGRAVTIGLEGGSVLVESMVVPASSSGEAESLAAKRLKGDPVFNDARSALEVSVAPATGRGGQSMVILAAVNRERIAAVMEACRAQTLAVQAVEAAALASWRAWSGIGNQLRLVRGEKQDIILAGVDGKLGFCRVVDGPVSSAELRATITRVASLFAGSFNAITINGHFDDAIDSMVRGLGLEIRTPDEDIEDAQALGLSREGIVLTEFTPPEERDLRTRRKARKARLGLVAVGLSLAVFSAVLGFQRIYELEADKLGVEAALVREADDRAELERLEQRLNDGQAVDASVELGLPGHRMSRLFSVLLNATPAEVTLELAVIDDVEEMPEAAAIQKRDRRKKPMTEGPRPRSLVVHLNGLAAGDTVVNQFAADLFASEAFDDVRIEASERVLLENGTEGERFKIYARARTR